MSGLIPAQSPLASAFKRLRARVQPSRQIEYSDLFPRFQVSGALFL